MSRSDRDEALRNAAWDWVVREHEHPPGEASAELIAWLKEDPAHLKHYEEAHRVWLAAALVPASSPEDDAPPTTPED